jgi:predicted RNA-binding protein YlqC (UPF0109 family)
VANSIDQQFIEYIVKSLVSKPDEVKIERRIDEKGVLLELTVDPEDLGRVIGKRGATAQSLRTLLRALGTKNDARYNLKIVDTGRPADYSDNSSSSSSSRPKKSDSTDEPTNGDDDIIATNDDDDTEDHSSAIDRTRKELAELDDLDV